jgi:hypothetical protein
MKLIDVAYYLAESAIRHELGAYPNILKNLALSHRSANGDDIQSMLDKTVG